MDLVEGVTESSSPELPELMEIWQETLGWCPDAVQQAQFQQLYDRILTANRQFNLTRITEPTEFWEKHLWDSLRGIQFGLTSANPSSSHPLTAIDIGTGAGFPGLPIAIAHPDWSITLLDSTRKKITFIDTLITEMNLKQVNTCVDRVEQIGQHTQHRERYDLALVRAVAAAPVCAEYALPLLKIGGMAVLYRGQWTEEEGRSINSAVQQLGGTVETIESFTTPLSGSDRTCVYLKKIGPTVAKFPRPAGVPAQKPLA